MKAFYPILILVALVATSCQKVIDVKLNNAAPQYVIQGEITDGPGPYFITISRTKDFSADNTFDKVSGAQVVISDSSANVAETLKEISAGTYQTSVIAGTPGHTYHLSVVVNGQTFSATSTMPSQAVNIDTLYAGPSMRGGSDTFMTAVFTDPAGKGNYYLLRQWVNGQQIKSTHLRSDDVTDGQTYAIQLRYENSTDSGNPSINKGDSITAELDCINKQVYDFYRTLQAVTGASNTATPTNPLTNITGGALGVFNTCTSRKKTTVIKF